MNNVLSSHGMRGVFFTTRELQQQNPHQKVHGGSVLAVKPHHPFDEPSQATQASASVVLLLVAFAGLGFLWLLIQSLRGGKDATGMHPVPAFDDDARVAAASVALGSEAEGCAAECSAANLMGRKGSKKAKAKSKWGRGLSKERSGGKHQSLPTDDFDDDLELQQRGRKRGSSRCGGKGVKPESP